MSKRPITSSDFGLQSQSDTRPVFSRAVYRTSSFNLKRGLITLLVALLFFQTTGLTFGQGLTTSLAQPQTAAQQDISGTLYATVGDPASGTRAPSRTLYWLLADSNQAYDLNFSADYLHANPGLQNLVEKRVKVSGAVDTSAKAQAVGQTSAFQVSNLVTIDTPQAHAQPRLAGSQPFISILCKFQDNAAEPQNRNYFVDQLTGANNPINFDKYFREMSFNTIDLQGSDVQGWYTLPKPRSDYISGTPEKADLKALAQDCTALAKQANVDFSKTYGINLMFNGALDSAAWGGKQLLNLTGQNKAWPLTWMPYAPPAPGYSQGTGSIFGWPSMTILAHEMDHAFGALHSNDPNGNEYGSAWDVVSKAQWNCTNNGALTSFVDPTYGCVGQGIIAFSRAKMGILPTSKLLAYDGSMGAKTVTLERLSQPTNNNPLMIKIPIGQDPNRYYTVEARYRVGFDAKLPTDGILIHNIDESGKSFTRGNPAQLVIPPNAANIGDDGAAWLPNMTFNDTTNNIAITVQSATATGFVVVVNAPDAINLSVTQTDSGAPTAANNNTTVFTTTVTAQGATAAKNVMVTPRYLFPQAFYIPLVATVSQGTFDPNNRGSAWAVGDMQPGSTATLSVTYPGAGPSSPTGSGNGQKPRATAPPTSNGVVGSFAKATADNLIPDKHNTKNYASSGDTPVSDLDLFVDVSDNSPYVGDVVTFTVSVLNLGPYNATNISITNQLPAGLNFISASPSVGTYNAATGLWTIPALANQQEALLKVVARATQAKALTLTATKLGQDQFDPNSSNDSDYDTAFASIYTPLPYYDSQPVEPLIYDVDTQQSPTYTPIGGDIGFNSMAEGKPISFSLMINNLGDAPLQLTNPTFAGINPADFKVNFISTTIAPTNQQLVNLTCTPSGVGTRDAYLTINTNDTSLNQSQAIYHLTCVGLYDPSYTPPPAYTYNLPFVANNANGFTSYLAIQNVANTSANVQVQYYDGTGNTYTVASASCSQLAPNAECTAPNPLAVGTKGTSLITSNQPLAVIVAESTPYGSSAYAVNAGTSSRLVAPLAINNSGGFNTQLTIANGGASEAAVTVNFYDQSGRAIATATKNLSLAPYSAQTLDQTAADSGLAPGFYGWAMINGAAGGQLTAQVLEQRADIKFIALANAQAVGNQTTLYAPAIFKGAFGGFNTGANIVNFNANPVTTTVTYYSNTGTAYPATPFVIPGYGIAGIFQGGQGGTNGLPAGAGLPTGFYGSATVTTAGGSVAMVVNEANGTTSNGAAQSGTYTAAASGSSKLGLPAMDNNANGFTTGATILNTSGATVSGTITYYNTNGTAAISPQPFTVGANASYPAYQGAAGLLPNGFSGQAVINQTSGPANSLIATTNVQSPSLFYTYTETGQ